MVYNPLKGQAAKNYRVAELLDSGVLGFRSPDERVADKVIGKKKKPAETVDSETDLRFSGYPGIDDISGETDAPWDTSNDDVVDTFENDDEPVYKNKDGPSFEPQTTGEIDTDSMGPQFANGGAFRRLVGKLKKRGHSTESAKAIAYTIGVNKYGKKGMAAKASAGRK